MKNILLILVINILVGLNILAQSLGDYRSAQSGNWNSASTWQWYNGTDWVSTTVTPTYSDGVITIQNGHTVTITANVTADQLIISLGAVLTIDYSQTLTLNNGDGIDCINNGRINCNNKIEGDGTLVNYGLLYFENGEKTVNVTIINETSGTLKLTTLYSDPIIVNVASGLENKGTIEIQSGYSYRNATLNIISGSLINKGTLNILQGISDNTTNLNASINNQGTINIYHKTSTSKASATHLNTNTGVINVSGADWSISGSSATFTNDGTISIASGKTLSFSSIGNFTFQGGSLTIAGTLSISSTIFDFDVSYTNQSGGTVSIVNSTTNFNSQFTNKGSLQLLSGGTLNGTLVNEGTLHLENNTFTVNASVTNSNGATFKVKGHEYDNGTIVNVANGFTNHGNLVMEYGYSYRGATLNINSGTLTNASDGTITTQPGSTNGTVNLNGLIDNQGTINLGVPLAINNTLSCSGVMNCSNYDLSGSGTFNLQSGGTLYIGSISGITTSGSSGSIQTANRSFSSSANYIYSGTLAQVTGNGLPATVNNLTINNASGVTLSNDITIDGSLTLTNGDLLLNGNTCTLGESANLSETAGNTLKGTTGKIITTRTFNAGDLSSGVNIAGLGAKITTSTGLGSTTIERLHNQALGGGNSSISRIFRISPTNNNELNATLEFYYDESELAGINENNLRLFKSLDGTNNSWVLVGGTPDPSNNKVTITGLDGFSYWTLGDISNPLPVELVSLFAKVNNHSVILNWQTATEVNNYGFEIERAAILRQAQSAGCNADDNRQAQSAGYNADDNLKNQNDNVTLSVSKGEQWQKLGFVQGFGNSNAQKTYTFTDNTPPAGKVQYRLKQIDNDGSFKYSDVIEVNVDAPSVTELYQNYPNPFNPTTTIAYKLAEDGYTKLTIYDISGREIKTIVNEKQQAGSYQVNYNGSELSGGVYFYKLQFGNKTQIKKFILMK